MKFDISTYGLDAGIVDKVTTYLNLKGADVESGGLVEIGVPEDVATKIVTDYKASLEGGTDDKEGETLESETDQTEETEQTEGEDETETSDGTGESDDTEGADDTDDTDGTDGADATTDANATDTDTDDNTDWKQMYEELLFSNMVADAIRGIEFTSSFARDGVIDLIRKKNLQIVDGKLEGVSELIDEIKAEYPDAFAPTNKRPIFGRTRGTQSDSGTNSAMAYLAQRYKNNPYFR